MDIFNESAKSFENQKILDMFKSSRDNINWEIVGERSRKFIRLVYPLTQQFYSKYRVQDAFRSEDIECLVMDYINSVDKDKENTRKLKEFIIYVAYSGYKDEPELDGDGKPSSRRTTPVHHADKQYCDIIRAIFHIYNRYDVNYTDESGLSHFHVACMYGFDDAIKKFLELGQDPNCLWPETGDSPLHLYLNGENRNMRKVEMAEALLRKSANLNLANKDGLTALHIISKIYTFDSLDRQAFYIYRHVAKVFFDISDELNQTLQVDVRDKLGNTPLHMAALNNNVYVTEMLLRRGADPNSANDEGSTPLHEIYKSNNLRYKVKRSLEQFFKLCDEVNESVQVDARDKLGRTPLTLAVANLWRPECIDVLFERGADLSNFIFPTANDFRVLFKTENDSSFYYKLWLASGALAVIERIENKGYQLKRSDALTIMECFAKYRWFEKSSDLEKCWYDDKFITRVKSIRNLTLDEVFRLRPEEAAKLLTYEDYRSISLLLQYKFSEEFGEPMALHLCEKLWRGFFQSWALDPFWELIHHRLPLECCEMIIEELKNEDLYNICLAAAGRIS